VTAFSAEEQERRRRGIGASEAAAVLGLSPWATPADVWARKLGLTEDAPESDAMAFGVRVEGLIVDWYIERTGNSTSTAGTMDDPGGRPIYATPDRIVYRTSPPGPRLLLEAKSTRSCDEGAGWGEEGTDAIPDGYLVQVAVQMACADLDRCDVAALDLSARRLRVYRVDRDRETERAIMDALAEWWERYVVRREAPPNTPAAVRWVSAEPLIEAVDLCLLDDYIGDPDVAIQPCHSGRLHWVVVGGESGPRARPCDLAWVRSIRDQCRAAGAAFFCKQLPGRNGKVLSDPALFPEDLRIREFPNPSA